MLEKLKKVGIGIAIAILFTIFVFAMTNVFYESPEYTDYCVEPKEVTAIDKATCGEIPLETMSCMGPIEYEYGADGCPTKVSCNLCYQGYESAMEKYNLILFIIASIAGVLGILFGLLFSKPEEFWEVLTGGFLLGGLISMFVGTAMYYNNMGKFLRPIVILAELAIVIFVTYKVIKDRTKEK